jgi:hypothetical protein
MNGFRVRELQISLTTLLVVSCAHPQHLTFAEVKYPRLQSESCVASTEPSQISVTVQDELGGAIEGAVVYLCFPRRRPVVEARPAGEPEGGLK